MGFISDHAEKKLKILELISHSRHYPKCVISDGKVYHIRKYPGSIFNLNEIIFVHELHNISLKLGHLLFRHFLVRFQFVRGFMFQCNDEK